jgi:pimeloyl-ACP methyl ester carboxylesterase
MQVLFAATYPERVSGLSLVNPSAKGLHTPDYPWARTEDEWLRLLRDVEEGWGTQEFSDRLLREQMPTVADDEGSRTWWVTYLRRSLSPGAAVAFYRMMMESDVSDVLPLVRAPTLVFHRDDQPGPAHYFVDRVPHSRRIERCRGCATTTHGSGANRSRSSSARPKGWSLTSGGQRSPTESWRRSSSPT